MSTPTFNVAVLGFGLSGAVFHIPLVKTTPGLNLTHIMSSQIDTVKAKYPDVNLVTDLNEILNNPNIDLVINTLPNSFHYQVTKECLEAGKHVIVEKPFVINSHHGHELIELAEQKNLLLSVYHNRRWDNGYLTLQKHLSKLGKIYLYEAYFDRFRPQVDNTKWRESGADGSGMLYDLGSHLFDQALNLFGQPTALFADLGKQRPNSQSIDYFHITLWYDEMRVFLGSSSISTAPRPVIAAYADNGSYVKYGLDSQENMLRQSISPNIDNFGIEIEQLSGILTLNKDDQLCQETITSERGTYPYYYQQIYNALLDNKVAPPVTAKSALKVITMIEVAIQSASLNKKMYLEN